MSITNHAVVIAGGGPTGLMLAAELVLARVDVAIVERRPSQALAGQRAGGLLARTLELLDQRGVVDRFLAEGTKHPIWQYAGAPFDMSVVPSRHNFVFGLGQNHIERILAGWVLDELKVPIYREREITGLAQDETGVDVYTSDGSSLRAGYLVGCDGGRSLVRKAAGIDFPGWDPTTSNIIAEVQMTGEPRWGMHRDALGVHGLSKMEDGFVRLMVTERDVGSKTEPTLAELGALLVEIYGTDFGMHSPRWISRFTDMTRQAAAYRDRRVFLAGDSAHVHAPDGGQGIQTGIGDAVNLGWKLGQVVRGASPDSLLDTYHSERHAVGARVLRLTMAAVALRRTDERSTALRETVAELLATDEPRRRYAARLAGLDIHYDLGEGHPLLGRRMPDLDLVTGGGPQRLFTLLHSARPVLLNLGEPGSIAVPGWGDRIEVIDASHAGAWELPSIGTVAAPGAVVIRPDGYVAWVGDAAQAGLTDALTRWFGAPA